MNEVIGYDTVGETRYPRFSGPCNGCGATNYGLSTSGPDFCAACATGISPEVSRLRRELDDLRKRHIDALLAIGLLTGRYPPINDTMRQRAEAFLERYRSGGSPATPPE